MRSIRIETERLERPLPRGMPGSAEPADGWRLGDSGMTFGGTVYLVLGQHVDHTGPDCPMFVQITSSHGSNVCSYELSGAPRMRSGISGLNSRALCAARFRHKSEAVSHGMLLACLRPPSSRGALRMIPCDVARQCHPRAMSLWVASAQPAAGWQPGHFGLTVAGLRYEIKSVRQTAGVGVLDVTLHPSVGNAIPMAFDVEGCSLLNSQGEAGELDAWRLLPPLGVL